MNSPKQLNYETRPAKFTERKMLLSTFLRLFSKFNGAYQYIGLGGLTFTDFKLFHKELHIIDMHSIEGGNFPSQKIKYNSPFSFIKIHTEFTTKALTKIDLTKKTLVWLDYDGTLDNYMFEDITLLFSKLPIGSIYIMTCNRELKNQETGNFYTVDEFINKFDNLTPFDILEKNFTGNEDFNTIRKMLLNLINKTIKDRNRIGDDVLFHQIYNIIYQENRGARMYTFGGIITDRNTKYEDLNLSDFDFVSNTNTCFKISLPNLTTKEIGLINKYISGENEINKLVSHNIVTKKDILKYKSVYKFLPSFFDVRL